MIRLATAADAAALARLEGEAIDGPWNEAMVAAELAAPGRFALVDGEAALTGWALFVVLGDEAELLRIAVAPAARRRGRGAALLREGRERLAAAGVERLFLEVRSDNAAALALYRRHGLGEVARRRRYYADGVDALVLSAVVGASGRVYPGSRTDELER